MRTLKMDEPLIREYNQGLRRRARRLAGSPDKAEDLLQEAWERALRYQHQYEGRGSLGGWLHRILYRTFINCRRREARLEPLQEDVADGSSDRWEARFDIVEAMRELPPDLSRVVYLKYYRDLKQEEIAGLLDLPLTTVKKRLYRGLRRLRPMLIS